MSALLALLACSDLTAERTAQLEDATEGGLPVEEQSPITVGEVTYPSVDAFMASGARCGSDLSEEELRSAEALQWRHPAVRAFLEDGIAPAYAGTISVDVYVHVITKGSGSSNGELSASEIADQIEVLNDAYQGAGMDIEFNLVSTDYKTKSSWYTMSMGSSYESSMKSSMRQGGADALNLYFLRPSGGVLGWSTWPWDYSADPDDDGVVIRNTTLPGGSETGYNEGFTAVHEIGHWLGLYHTFQGGCSTSNDKVKDTPAERSANYGCPSSRDTCSSSGSDPVTNYMDYSVDSCMEEFSSGQVSRMGTFWSSYR